METSTVTCMTCNACGISWLPFLIFLNNYFHIVTVPFNTHMVMAITLAIANSIGSLSLRRYELASGESYFRQGDLGRALKKFLAVEKHYADMTEDQFDFHSYCLRKMTLRAYVEMLRFQDRLHSHTYFHKAAAGAIRCSSVFQVATEILS